jgi:hypothetical protein
MEGMTKLSYVFIFVVIGLALLLHALDERSDREVIGHAASIALHDGVTTACEKRNLIRDSVSVTAAELHPDAFSREAVREGLNYENCDALARESVREFRKQLRDKDASRTLVEKLTGQ